MTREEIIEAIQNDDMMPFLQDWEARDVVDFVLKNYRPSLPSDLDEAAFSYENELWESGFNKCGYSPQEVSDAFKAGAQHAAPRWISVDEKLPEMDEEVIVLMDEYGTAQIYKVGVGHIVDRRYAMDFNGWNTPGVKFWMSCPKIPNND